MKILVNLDFSFNFLINVVIQTQRHQELAKYGLDIRSDSHYCNAYIKNVAALSLEETVTMMRIMNFLFNKTNYSSILSKYTYRNRYDDGEFDYHRVEITEHMKHKAKVEAIKGFIHNHGRNQLPDIVLEKFGEYIEGVEKKIHTKSKIKKSSK